MRVTYAAGETIYSAGLVHIADAIKSNPAPQSIVQLK